MLTLKDGPAKGTYLVKRAPMYVRAVVSQSGVGDVLDQLEDTPKPREQVYVYRLVTEVGSVHLNRGSRRGSGTGFYAMAGYEHMPEVDGEALRDNAAWQAWAMRQPLVKASTHGQPTE